MRHLISAIAIFLLLYANVKAQDLRFNNEDVLTIESIHAEDGYQDIIALSGYLEGKQIVAMGESTHGTKEFHKLRHKVLRYLVEEQGLKIIAVEAGFAEAFAVNEYVTNGEGNLTKAISELKFWPLNSKEFHHMVEWIRGYNQGKAYNEQVKFYGFDVQSPVTAARLVKTELANTGEKRYSQLKSLAVLSNLNRRLNKGELKNFTKEIDGLKKHLSGKPSAKDFDTALTQKLFLANVASMQYFLQIANNKTTGRYIRDKAMAHFVEMILEIEGEDQKMMLWAHNAHIERRSHLGKFGSMGYHLDKRFGGQYYTVALEFFSGSLRAVGPYGLANYTIESPKEGSLPFALGAINPVNFYIDLNQLKANNDAHPIFTKKVSMHSIGAIYIPQSQDSYYSEQLLSKAYDAVLFTRTSTPITHIAGTIPPASILVQSIDATPYAGKKVKFVATAKVPGNNKSTRSGLWMTSADPKQPMSAMRNRVFQQVQSEEWTRVELIKDIDKVTTSIDFGFLQQGKGDFYLDKLELYWLNDGNWEQIELVNPGLEESESGQEPSAWKILKDTDDYEITITDNESFEGSKSLLISYN
ncbi:MAG: erythromycin esterase family protein [Bacteroidota bacterium]